MHRIREDCRLCAGKTFPVLELPDTPLANELPRKRGEPQEEFPLYLAACEECGHVQLPVVVDPDRLFRDYVYVSGTSSVFREHFRDYAAELMSEGVWAPGHLVVEIGSNDGTMLRFFSEMGCRVLGVDPARGIAKRATDSGVETWPEFFDRSVAARILSTRGHARVVVANNVFAHADDLAEIALAAKHILDEDGLFVFEVSYLADVLRKTLFDTIYHEHLSYHHLGPLVKFFRGLGMSVIEARRVDTHGGSIRVFVSPNRGVPAGPGVEALLSEEEAMGLGTNPRQAFVDFALTISERREQLLRILRGAKKGGSVVAGYGAPAKATTLLRAFAAEEFFDYVEDENPLKQNRYLPGGKTPILWPDAGEHATSNVLVVVLAWNFADSIVEKLRGFRERGGSVVVPLPEVVVHGPL